MAVPDVDDKFFYYESRLASFQGAQPISGKGRASTAGSRAPKALHWPHKKLPPVDLAKAGFFFEPHAASPDNVVCFLCAKSLDGWEDGDNPAEEHIKHSPTCGWAIMVAIESGLEGYGRVHPLDPDMIEARKATFAGRWPYESKKGFKCKTKQMVEAGWKYTPTFEADDMATCAYCQLALEGWESGDKPFDEHYKRSPDCPFFLLLSQYPAPKKAGRAKAARASKASRLSVQSVATIATAASDLASVADLTLTADHDDSVMTTTSIMTQGGKKTTRAKKAPAKGRKTKAKKDEPVEILEDEPEVPQEVPPPKPSRGRKRASDAMEDATATNAEAPAPKKRAVRAKPSTVAENSMAAEQDLGKADAPAPTKQAAGKKKAARGSTAKASRKTSQASTTSLHAEVPDDEEIERQLQADLERPLTEDENDVVKSKPKAAAKGRPKKSTAAGKPSMQSQKDQSEAYSMFDPNPVEPTEDEIERELNALGAEMEAPEPATNDTLTVPKKGRKPGTRKVSKQTKKAKTAVPDSDPSDAMMHDAPEQAVEEVLPVKELESDPVVDPNASTGSVVHKPAVVKRPRGRPSKKSTSSQASIEDPQARRSSVVPVDIEVQIESSRTHGSMAGPARVTSPKITRKPVPAPARTTPPEPAKPVPKASSEKALPPPPSTPRARATPSAYAKQATISPSQSPQSSDAENQPPSSKAPVTAKRVALAPVAATPVRGSPTKLRNVVGGLQSTTPWRPADLDVVFVSPTKNSPDKENTGNGVAKLLRKGGDLTSPEKGMTVEEWIYHNAGLAEQKLRSECEAMVSAFEREGARAMGVLEGLVVD